MKNPFVEELRWRGMLHDIMPETENHLNEKRASGYIGLIQPQIRSILGVWYRL